MKVALVHDYLREYGGAERVLSTLHAMYPKAPIYTILTDKRGMGSFWNEFEDAKIHTSWFGKLPFASKLISPLRFLLPAIWGGFDFSGYDLVIDSASWAVTRGFKKDKNTLEICYIHTPPRYLYGYDTSRRWQSKWYGAFVGLYSAVVNHYLRMYDFESAQKVNYFVVNSENVGRRVAKFYRRDYKVIYPPVAVEKITKTKTGEVGEEYYIAGGRMVAAKNFDLIIEGCAKAGVSLKIFGSGVDAEKLKKMAGPYVEFLGNLPDAALVKYWRGAKAFILAQKDEDFGMTSVEAQAAGCPCIAYRGGGYLESVVEGKTGVFFDELTPGSLAGAISKFEKKKINSSECVKNAKRFSKEHFEREFKNFVKHVMKEK